MKGIALALACTLGCRGGTTSDPPAPGNGAAASDARTVAITSATGGPRGKLISPDIRSLPQPKIDLPQVESYRLFDAGAAPRALLRYHWDPQANREVVVEAALTSRRLDNGVWSAALAVAPVREGLGLITEPPAGGGGGARLQFRGLVGEVGDAPDADAKTRAEEYLGAFRELIEHRRGTGDVDDRGHLQAVVFTDAQPATNDRAVDELQQRWIAAAVPLPTEPVGKGAHWRVITILRAGAAVLKQTAEYTLVEVQGDRWIIDEDVRRIGEDQLVNAPGLPTDTIAELIAMFRENKGRVEVSKALPWPIAGKVTTEVRVHARIGVPGQGVHEDITEDLGTLTFSSK